MKTVFEPSNSLEGYMLQDLLKQRGIDSRLDGAHLQGGVGELPASGLVRLVVNDEDFRAARAVIDDWEATHVTDPIPPNPRRGATGLAGALVGLLVGAGATYAYLKVPVPSDGIDHDGDGSLDERWFVSASGTPIRTEIDRNFDGKADFVYRFDRRGRLDVADADDDFDGVFETRWSYARGITAAEVDSDRDGRLDTRYTYSPAAEVVETSRIDASN